VLAEEVRRLTPAVVVAHVDDWARVELTEAITAAGSLALAVDDRGLRVLAEGDRPLPTGPQLDAATTVLTSGTTGAAKRLAVSWADFVAAGGGAPGRPAESGRGAIILSLPLVTLGGMLSVARLVFGGRPMAMMERFDVHEWARLVRQHRPSVVGAPPPVVKMLLDAGLARDHFAGVRAFVTSSGPVAPDVARAFEDRYGVPVLLGYGATEFLGAVTGWTPELWQEYGTTKLGSVGRANPGVGLRVVDADSGDEVPVGVEGLLDVDPPRRAQGLPDGWLRTNDRARIDADGFVWILGRADDVVVRGGFKVDLGDVEAALRRHPAVVDALAVGIPDHRLGTVPAAVVVTRAGSEVTPDELVRSTREWLPAYAVPVAVRLVDEIPRTSTMKPARAVAAQILGATG
jgi:acyl-coenzyme A synthetase/AMP-(fatty) acid ligase